MDIFLIYFTIISIWPLQYASAEVIALNAGNEKDILGKHDFVLINFYADWCRFSAMLMPIIDSVAEKLPTTLPNSSVAIAKIDCDTETELAKSHKINKYPTIKLSKYGEVKSTEYRGQRSVEALLAFLTEESKSRITLHESTSSLPSITSERAIVGIFREIDRRRPTYLNFFRISHLVDGCKFHAAPANVTVDDIYFQKKSNLSLKTDCPPDIISSPDALTEWAMSLCTPLVPELTFANAEELTEIGLPLLILFYHPNDTDTASRFVAFIEKHFSGFPRKFTFLYANGVDFSHPLMHLGKSSKDLPLLCIDSFQHMYLYNQDIEKDLQSGDKTGVSEFMNDLGTGKLHRQFHGQPEPSPGADNDEPVDTTPPDSVFRKLAPSHNRYSLIHEEL